jgi:hypothetical protein
LQRKIEILAVEIEEKGSLEQQIQEELRTKKREVTEEDAAIYGVFKNKNDDVEHLNEQNEVDENNQVDDTDYEEDDELMEQEENDSQNDNNIDNY